MERVYVAVIDSKVTAFHENKKIVKKYLKWYKESHHDANVVLARSTSNFSIRQDYRLVPVGSIYVQERYENIYFVYSDNGTEDIDKVIKQLKKLLLSETSVKRQKILCDGLDILEQIRKQIKNYVPTVSELEDVKQRIDAYQYNMSYN